MCFYPYSYSNFRAFNDNEHPIAKLVGYIEDPLCIVMKKYDTNLSDLIHGYYWQQSNSRDIMEPISKKISCGLAIDIAKGMSALHGASIIHFDLKPANVLIDEIQPGEFKAVITDFGMCSSFSLFCLICFFYKIKI